MNQIKLVCKVFVYARRRCARRGRGLIELPLSLGGRIRLASIGKIRMNFKKKMFVFGKHEMVIYVLEM